MNTDKLRELLAKWRAEPDGQYEFDQGNAAGKREAADELEASLPELLAEVGRLTDDLDRLRKDAVRLDWLEHMARHGGIFLYNGVDVQRERQSAVGIGLRSWLLDRTLRQGIDSAMPDAFLTEHANKQIRVDSSGNAIDTAIAAQEGSQ